MAKPSTLKEAHPGFESQFACQCTVTELESKFELQFLAQGDSM